MRSPVLWGALGAFVVGFHECLGHDSQSGSWLHKRDNTPAQNYSVTTDSTVTNETAKFFPKYKSERVKITYGPFSVPPMSVNNGMEDFIVEAAQKPCTDCLVTWIQAGLEYPNGTVANADTGLWLHHTVFSNTNRTAIVCPEAEGGDQFFASGNERTPADICVNGTDQAGYYIAPGDNIAFLLELMNMVEYSREAVLTVTWEYIPSVPSVFDKVKPLWLDIGGCGSSDQPAKANQTFQYTDPAPWTSNFTGRITWIGGHLHDGATHLNVMKNDTVLCDCVAAYGQNAAYIDGGSMGMSSGMSGMSITATAQSSGMASMSMGTSTNIPASTSTGMAGMDMGTDTVHISSISTCSNSGTIGVSDILSLTAYYNSTKYSLMANTDGSLAPIMGISIIYVADMNLTSTAVNTTDSGTSGTGAPSATTSKSFGTRGLGSSVARLLPCCGLALSLLAVI